MKELSEIEIKNKIIKYLNNKGIVITFNKSNDLIWNYEPHYSKFKIDLYFNRIKSTYSIRYYVNYSHYKLKNLKRRKTSISNGYCLKIYKNLIWLKEKLDIIATEIKKEADNKNKYCTELESYYFRKHKSVYIKTNILSDDSININIDCYDEDKSTFYYIIYKNNKYYLISKVEKFS